MVARTEERLVLHDGLLIRDGGGSLCREPERPARVGLSLLTRQADVSQKAIIEFEQDAALLLLVMEPEYPCSEAR
jgi:hypothetical protein